MAIFGKKQEPTAQAPTEIPTERVLQMRQQGMDNNAIIDGLQKEGYDTTHVYDAISQADIKTIGSNPAAAEPLPPQETPPPGQPEISPQGIPPMPAEQGMPPAPLPAQGIPPPPMPPKAPDQMPPMQHMPEQGITTEHIEEIAESIIDEKWEELIGSVDKIVSWKEDVEKRMGKMDHQINELKSRFDELHKGILAKVGDYDKTMRSVGSDIKAMESVFKKILPEFTENINELSRLTSRIKKKKTK